MSEQSEVPVPVPKSQAKHISKRLYMTHIVQYLYGKYPDTEFAFQIIPYEGRRSLKISWYGAPCKADLRNFMDMYQGAEIDEDGVARRTETMFSILGGKIEMVHWGFDFILLNQREIRFI